MPSQTVVIVVDPRFGERLAAIADAGPIWIADTSDNSAAARRLRSAHPATLALTTFLIDPAATPEAWFLEVLDDVDLHHGLDSQRPAWQHLRCYGAELSDAIVNALAAYDVRTRVALPDGFRASKTGPAVG